MYSMVIKTTTYKGSSLSGWEVKNVMLETIPVEGKNYTKRLEKAMDWCADACTVSSRSMEVFEVVGEKSNSSRTHIPRMQGFTYPL